MIWDLTRKRFTTILDATLDKMLYDDLIGGLEQEFEIQRNIESLKTSTQVWIPPNTKYFSQ